jgi:hypothetical protein
MRRLGGDLWLMLWTGKLFEGLCLGLCRYSVGISCWRLVLPLSLCYHFDDVDFGMENIHPSAFD